MKKVEGSRKNFLISTFYHSVILLLSSYFFLASMRSYAVAFFSTPSRSAWRFPESALVTS